MLNKLNWFLTTALLLAVIYLMNVVTHVARVSNQNSIFIANTAKTKESLENNVSWEDLTKDHRGKSSRIVENEKRPSEVFHQDTKELNTNKIDNSIIKKHILLN